MKFIRVIIYKFGGAIYELIQHCSEDIKKQYRHLGYAVIICTIMAAIAGADITHQYTNSLIFTIAGSILFAALVFSFDYFINNSNSNKIAPKLLRIPVAIANVFLGTAALMVWLYQARIDTKLNLENSHTLISCDSTYQVDKAQRYAGYDSTAREITHYHSTVCYKEAQNGYAGINYQRKHQYCITQDFIQAIKKTELDSSESPFYNSYQTKRASIKEINNADFPTKCAVLPEVFRDNWFTLLVAVCVFIISFYVECQSLIMKFSINKNDDYHTAVTLYNTLHKTNIDDRLKKMTEHLNKLNGLKADQANTDEITKWATDKLNSTLTKAPIHYKLNEYKRILKENGMQELSNEIANIQNTITDTSDMEKAMNQLINKINRN